MKPAEIESMKDDEITELISTGQAVLKAREERRKQEAITKIKEIAASQHLSVHFDGQRGRPPKVKTDGKEARNGR